MPALADLQRRMSRALLADPSSLAAELFAAGPIPAHVALLVHRNTVFGGLADALRLTFPTVDRLVGEEFFDQAACAFATLQPPRQASLSAYGDGFPAFLAAYTPAIGLDYLPDVARLDLAIDRAGAAPDALAGRLIPIDPAVALAVPISLSVLALDYPAEPIRAALEADNDAALAAIDLAPSPNWLAVWRSEAGASVRPLSPPAGRFLAGLLGGATADQAVADASGAALVAIQAEVFAAPFATVTPIALEEA